MDHPHKSMATVKKQNNKTPPMPSPPWAMQAFRALNFKKLKLVAVMKDIPTKNSKSKLNNKTIFIKVLVFDS